MLHDRLGLYLVADPAHCRGDLVDAVRRAISGGVTCVQLRAKSLTDREHFRLASRMVETCRATGIPFLVNDRLDIALASGADGIHLGVHDLPVETVRRMTPPQFIIGFSPESDMQIRTSRELGASYLGIGPVFGTRTKSDAGQALGLEELARRCALSHIPTVGIGGITAGNAQSVIAAGASGVAVVSAILAAEDPAEAARMLCRQSGM
jgi:thiamine-phosphate pyrophosphorylase